MNVPSYQRGYLLEDFRLFHLSGAPTEQIDYHYHEFHKLLLLFSGDGGYAIEGDRYALCSGDMVLVGSHCVHRPEFDRAYERLIIYISPEFLQKNSTASCNLEEIFSSEHRPVLRLPEPEQKRLFSLASALERELSSGEYGRDILSCSLLLRLLVEIGRNLRGESNLPSPIIPSNPRTLEIMAYIDAHLSEDLTIDAIAEHFFVSKYHMMRSFRHESGQTIHGYILDRRLLCAKDLLLQGLHATDACYRSGFHSYSSFTRAYSKRFGCTPTGRKSVETRAEETFE